ncbi:condensation domain-containing protein [Burkholderia pyrrocinia]|uniref:condensation domain-containing protein n=1 Tax=Burkholderia pyrrocinia TaxID=60550 RepID=UPI0034A02248
MDEGVAVDLLRRDGRSAVPHRTALLRLSPTRHWWYLQVHHIALDGFGYGLLQQAVAVRYNARVGGGPLPALPDWRIDRVVEADARYRADGGFDADRAFWRAHLRDVPGRAQVRAILERRDARRIVVVGPCSIHDPCIGWEATEDALLRARRLLTGDRVHSR